MIRVRVSLRILILQNPQNKFYIIFINHNEVLLQVEVEVFPANHQRKGRSVVKNTYLQQIRL